MKLWSARGMAACGAMLSIFVSAQAAAADSPGVEARYRALAARQQPGNPDADYALGLAAIDAGHYAEAIVALQRVLALQPSHSRARAEIARAYALSGDIDTARSEFGTVLNDPTLPDPVRARVGKLVRGYDHAIGGGGGAITGFADAEAGYDSNINTATSLTSITLPLFAVLGPATLNGAATRNDAAYYQVQAGVSGVAGLSRQTRGFASVLGSWRDARGSAAFDQAGLTGTAGIAVATPRRDTFSFSGQVQRIWLGHAGFRTGVGGIVQFTRPAGPNAAWSLQGQYFRLDYDGDPQRDADRLAGTVNYSNAVLYANLAGGRERTIRSAARQLGFWFVGGQAGTEYPLSNRVAIVAAASVEHRQYQAFDPLFLAGRRDTQVDASLGVRFVLAKGLSVRPRLTYTRNFSNLGLYDFSRFTASGGLRFEF